MPDWTTTNGIQYPTDTPTEQAGVNLKENFERLAGRALTTVAAGRLTLESNVPVSITNQTAKSTIYFTPFRGNEIGLYDTTDSIWLVEAFSQLSIKLTDDSQTGSTTSSSAVVTGLTDTSQLIVGMEVTGTGIPTDTLISSIDSATQVTLDKNATATGSASLTFKVPPYTLLDLFVHNDSGTLKLSMTNWVTSQTKKDITGATNASPIVITSTAHGLSDGDLVGVNGVGGNTAPNGVVWTVDNAATDTFELQGSVGNGAYTSGGTWYKRPTSRASALSQQDSVYVKNGAVNHRYLGTCMTTDQSGECEDSDTRRLLWNENNRVDRKLLITEPTESWSYSLQAYRPANNKISNRVELVIGRSEAIVRLTVNCLNGSAGTGNGRIGFGVDQTEAIDSDLVGSINIPGATGNVLSIAPLTEYPAEGFHYYQWIESTWTSTITFQSLNTGGVVNRRSGILGTVEA